MNNTTLNPTADSTSKPMRMAWLILILVAKLMVITAMQSKTISDFIYQGF
ncbi:MAG: hypothetical protein IH984_00785 [Planctomycetes bacterium]|nr:hypothetical protein [Planctomycetota bacterium]